MPRRRKSAPYLTHRHWTISDARAALREWEKSGSSMRSFAKRAGLDVRRLYRWRRRIEADEIRQTEMTPEFVELRPHAAQPVEVVLRSGRMLRVAETIDAAALLRLVRALEEEPAC